ncbi:MAG: efflux RND transporter permease subunit [Bryobacteraceae bacterium]|nr:efflux RND transporter permease subunit [Bryobacteraceae bacterium]
MPGFSIRRPYLIVVVCLIIAVVGITAVARMPVDLFPAINIPVVVVATFFSGMPPEQIEADITGRFERFFTLASNIEHIESRSLPGVSLIKIYFQPGTDADSAVTNISNLAMANLRRLPPGTLPPVVLKFDASSLPVCLIALKGEGLNETILRDTAQYAVRNQVANVAGASVPQPFGGRYRQIMVYVDPLKLEAYHMSAMDVVRAVNESNLILPAGDVRIGPINYSIYTNSQVEAIADINHIPLKAIGPRLVTVGDVGSAKDAQQIQNNIVRVDGQPSVYLPVLKQGGDTNTISVVDGVRDAVASLVDVPKQLVTRVVFDQSQFVKGAIQTLVIASDVGLLLTAVIVFAFLSSGMATLAVLLSVPISALAAFIALSLGGSSINTMVLGGLALAFTRLLFNSLVVLESIFRHLDAGKPPVEAAADGASEVSGPVLAATLTTMVVFFPVTFLFGVSKFLFSALAAAVVLALAASFFVALTVIPLLCARVLKQRQPQTERRKTALSSLAAWSQSATGRLTERYVAAVNVALRRPWLFPSAVLALFVASLLLYPLVRIAFFPRTDAGQFVINIKAQSGSRLEVTEREVQKVEDLVRTVIPAADLGVILSNIGVTPGFSSIYTSNSAQHTAFVQVNLNEGHQRTSYEYMDLVRRRLNAELPHLSAYFQSGGLADSVLNLGLPAPIDVQVSGSDLAAAYETAASIAERVRGLDGVSDVYIPQDLDYPALKVDIDRTSSGRLGLNQKEIVQNVITALTSNQMIAPSYWVDHRTGNDYLLTVQYPEGQIRTLSDLTGIPIRAPNGGRTTRLASVSSIRNILAPTEVDHYQLRRVIDVYVAPSGEDLGRISKAIDGIIAETKLPEGIRVDLRGMVQGMRQSFVSFGTGLVLATALLYLILVAQFRSFVDPLLILSAVPMGITGVLVILALTGTSLNVMSLMGTVMMVGVVVSNSILIIYRANRLFVSGLSPGDAIVGACRTSFRAVLMTSLATVVGLLPLAIKIGTGGEAYVPMARAIIGGMLLSVISGVFVVPALWYAVRRHGVRRAA